MFNALKKELWLGRTSKKCMISRIYFLCNRELVEYHLCAVQNVALYRVDAETPSIIKRINSKTSPTLPSTILFPFP